MLTERDAYLYTLAKNLSNYLQHLNLLTDKNLLQLKELVRICRETGDLLLDSWKNVIDLINNIDYLHKIINKNANGNDS